jgi:2-polyprenyl-3-methyl-5-hydroxy-6-metoxy-1,4-benzoquinol methylase
MPSPGVSSVSIRHTRAPGPGQLEVKLSPFDQHHYQSLIRAREEAIRKVLRRLNPALGLKTALDAGAGVGFFSQTLADCGLSVRGFDGRAENVAEARKRFPHIAFAQADLEDHTVLIVGEI